ncbi:MAG: hypothetical protein ABI169_04810, partial [Chitinophagaceae bacterium]
MKIAIVTGLLTKWDVDIDAGHCALRFSIFEKSRTMRRFLQFIAIMLLLHAGLLRAQSYSLRLHGVDTNVATLAKLLPAFKEF